jgi:hypothetical protein
MNQIMEIHPITYDTGTVVVCEDKMDLGLVLETLDGNGFSLVHSELKCVPWNDTMFNYLFKEYGPKMCICVYDNSKTFSVHDRETFGNGHEYNFITYDDMVGMGKTFDSSKVGVKELLNVCLHLVGSVK